MTAAERTEELAARGDLDGLLRHLDALVHAGHWDEVLRLRRLSRSAIDRGHQVWPAATHAEYRLALDAPPRWCAQVLDADAGRFALGPLGEVAANHHTWDELSPFLGAGPVREQFALERIVRGEDLRNRGLEAEFHSDLPLATASWEPVYPLAEYTVDEVVAESPRLPPPGDWQVAMPSIATERPALIDDPQAVDALRAVASHWVDRSNGRCEVLAIEGDRFAALKALGVPRPRVVELEPALALALVAWAAGCGGAEGRRRGMAAARFDVWWMIVALGGLIDEWPLHPDEVGEIADDLRWFAWDASEPITGWTLRVVIEDRTDCVAWILSATDS